MSFKSIIKLMDIKTLVAGFIPVILGSIYSKYAFGKFNVFYLILLIFAMILIQSSTNMINDYFDFKRGADSKRSEDGKALVSGEITPKQFLFIIFLYQFIAYVIGIFIASQTSYYILLVAVIGGIISVSYAFGRKTLPIIIGIKNAEKLWIFNVIMLLILTVGLVLIHIYPIVVLVIVILLFPYELVFNFLSYDKNNNTKVRSMRLIGQVGLKYHLAVITGLLIAIIM